MFAEWPLRKRTALWSLTLLAILALALTPPVRAAGKAALFVPEVLPSAPVRPLEWITSPPRRETVALPLPDGSGTADLYRPAEPGRHPGVVVFLGVAPAGPDDPRVAGLANALARTGFVTLVYWSPTMLAGRIDAADVAHLVAAFSYLRSRPEVDPTRVGFGGFCVGASFVLVAANQPAIAGQVAFVNAFAPYTSLRDLARQIASHTAFSDGETRPWPVDPLAEAVFRRMLLSAIPDDATRALVDQALAAGAPEPAGLGPTASAVFRLLRGVPLAQTDELLAQLPPAFLDHMAQVSPRNHLEHLRAELLIMHGVGDTLVPVEESRRLVAELRPTHGVQYTEFALFQHVDPTNPVGTLTYARDLVRLAAHLTAITRWAT